MADTYNHAKDIKEQKDFFYRQAISIAQYHQMEAALD